MENPELDVNDPYKMKSKKDATCLMFGIVGLFACNCINRFSYRIIGLIISVKEVLDKDSKTIPTIVMIFSILCIINSQLILYLH